MQINISDNYECKIEDVPFLTEDALLDPSMAKAQLAKKKLKIEKIEENENGEKIVTMKESTNNLLCG